MSIYFRREEVRPEEEYHHEYFRYEIEDENSTPNDEYLCENTYYQTLKTLPKLGRKTAQLLYQRMVKGDATAREELIMSQLNMVVEVAKCYENKGVPFDDLVQEGNLAMMDSLDKYVYRPNLGIASFLRQEVHHHLARLCESARFLVRLPTHMYEQATEVKKAIEHLTHALCRRPTFQDIADYLHIGYDKVKEIHRYAGDYLSEEDEDTGFEYEYTEYIVDTETLPIVDQLLYKELREELIEQLKTLTPREAQVIAMRFGFDDGRAKTLEEVGYHLQITRERIRQIEAKALRKLRHPGRSKHLKSFMNWIDAPTIIPEPFDGLAGEGITYYLETRNLENEMRPFTGDAKPIEVTMPQLSERPKIPVVKTRQINVEEDDDYDIYYPAKNHYRNFSEADDLEFALYTKNPYNIEYSHYVEYNNSMRFWVMNFSRKPVHVAYEDLKVDNAIVHYYKILDEIQPGKGKFIDIPVLCIKEGKHKTSLQLELLDDDYECICKAKRFTLVVDYKYRLVCIESRGVKLGR